MSKELFFEETTIRQYVNGDLTGQLLIDFKKELKSNEDLKTEVSLAAFLTANYNLTKKKHFKTLIPEGTIIEVPKEDTQQSVFNEKVKSDTASNNVKKLKPNWIKYAAAAVFVLALAIGLLVMNNQAINAPQLATNYLEEPYAAPVISRGENIEAVWSEAVVAYKKEDYDKAVSSIQQIIDSGEAKEVHRFYLGLSHLYKMEAAPQLAIEQFETIKNGYYFDSAKWYESLAYLKLDDKEKAISILEGIENSSRNNEVKELLKSLK